MSLSAVTVAGCSDDAGSGTQNPAPGGKADAGSTATGDAGSGASKQDGGTKPKPPDTSGPGQATKDAGGTGTPGGGGADGGAATDAAAGPTTSADGGTDAGTSGAACEKGAVKASEVVFIGESFIALSGAIPRLTTQLARDAGTIGKDESYRSYAVSGTQLVTNEIPMQYTKAKAAGAVKVILMDGGGNDLLLGSRCQGGFDASCKEIVTVVETLFKQFKTDGVKDVVYFFYPDPQGSGASIKGAMDILRPEMKKLCDGTGDVRCLWVDQRESWDGNYSTFTSDGIHPTEAGATASSKQIWASMVDNCVAQ